jgi:hypothetical protein
MTGERLAEVLAVTIEREDGLRTRRRGKGSRRCLNGGKPSGPRKLEALGLGALGAPTLEG